MADFQATVNYQPGVAIEGDFASANPRQTTLAGDSELVAGSSGVIVGRFGWITSGVVDNTGSGAPDTFISRTSNVAMIDTFLSAYSMTVPTGSPVTGHSAGDFWVKNGSASANTVGEKVFAITANGTCWFGAAGGTVSGGVETNFYAHTVGGAGELVKISTTPTPLA